MKSLVVAIALTLPTFGAFETWTNKDGREAKLEFVRMTEKDGEKAGEFRMADGVQVVIKVSEFSAADAKRLAGSQPTGDKGKPGAPLPANPSLYDAALKKIRAGRELTAEEKAKCNTAHQQYFDDLCVKNETPLNTQFPEKDRTDYYIYSVKMSIIDFNTHGGWPFQSDLRLMVLSGLKKRIEENNDPFVVFCSIFPALDAGEQEYAAQSFNKLLKADVFLADLAGQWLANHWCTAEKNPTTIQTFLQATGLKLTPKSDTPSEPQQPRNKEIRSLVFMGDVEYNQKHYPKAIAIYQQALDLADKTVAPKSWSDVAMIIAKTQHKAEEWKKSETLLKEIIRVREEHYGKETPETCDALTYYGNALYQRKQYVEAEPIIRRALAILEKNRSGDHPEVATGLQNLAWILHFTDRMVEAEPLMRRALTINKNAYGKDDPHVAYSLYCLAMIHGGTKRLPEAEVLMRQSLEMYVACSVAAGKKDQDLDMVVAKYGQLLVKMGDTQKQAREKIDKITDPLLKK